MQTELYFIHFFFLISIVLPSIRISYTELWRKNWWYIYVFTDPCSLSISTFYFYLSICLWHFNSNSQQSYFYCIELNTRMIKRRTFCTARANVQNAYLFNLIGRVYENSINNSNVNIIIRCVVQWKMHLSSWRFHENQHFSPALLHASHLQCRF